MVKKKMNVLLAGGDVYEAHVVYFGSDAWDEDAGDLSFFSEEFDGVVQYSSSYEIVSWWQSDFIPKLKDSNITHVQHKGFSDEWTVYTKDEFIRVFG